MIQYIYRFSLVISVCLGLNTLHAQVTIADALPGCLDNTITKAGQTCPIGGVNYFFDINGSGQFEVNNIDGISCCTGSGGGGDGEAYFEFATINIENYMNIQISFDYSAITEKYEDDSPGSPVFGCTGNQFPDNSHDQIVFYYSIDGGPLVQSLYVHGTSQTDFTGTWLAGPLNGSTLMIHVVASNKAAAEKFYFQNLVVTGTQKLSAGPDKTACTGQSVQLDGVGTGIWSGGAGVFSDNTSPTSTYTPDASEAGSTITLTYTGDPVYTGCATPSDQMMITVSLQEDATFSLSDFCAPGSGAPSVQGTQGGTFSFNPPPGDGATINPSTGVISNAVGGNSYTVQYTTPGNCSDTKTVVVNALEGPVGSLSGSAVLCPGQCATFSFTFTSGSEPYTLNLSVSPPGFSLPAIPGVSASQVFTICYSGTGPLPTFDQSTSTITIPTIYSGSGSLILTGISDGSGCPGMASGSFSLTLTNGPTANSAGPLTMCADPSGNATFDLTTLNNTITGGNGSLTVNWFEDAAGQIPIGNPSAYISSGGTVYAQVTNGSCPSDLVPITLIVNTTVIPFTDMLCAQSGQDACTICLTGNNLDLSFIFGDNNSYIVTVVDNSTSFQYTGTVSNLINLTVPVSGSTTFQLVDIQPLSGCPNIATYTDLVTINIVNAPEIDPIIIPPTCQSVILPPITGNFLTGNALYYTGSGGSGTSYPPGYTIYSSQTLYVYDEITGCYDEIIVDITIIPFVIFDDILPLEGCGSVVLPPITGSGVSADAFYNTDPSGSGTTYLPGTTVTSSITLYTVDPNADPGCIGNQVVLPIVIHDIPPIPVISAVDCSGGNNSGSIEVLSPVDGDYKYQIDSNPFQTSVNFSNLTNGSHTITVRDTLTNCSSSFQFNVNCNCANPAVITLPGRSGEICVSDTFRLNNISFGGGAVWVNVATNGQGIISPLVGNVSPFNIQYIPSAADAGKTIAITFTSNDPDGTDPCEATIIVFNLNVHALPLGNIQGPSIVCEKGSVHLTATGGAQYLWSDNGGSQASADFVNIVKQTTFYVTITDVFGCDNVLSHNVQTTKSSAGRDTFAVFCNVQPATVNLFDYLSKGIRIDGIWKSGKDTIKTADKYLVTTLPLGDTLLRYIINDPYCGRDTAQLLLTITPGNNAGADFTGQYCEGSGAVLNLYNFLGKYDKGGTWSVTSSGSIDISDPSKVNINNTKPGVYEMEYIISGNNCLPDTARVKLFVIAKPNAGNDVITSACIGSQVDLFSLLKSVDLTGQFNNVNNYQGLTGSVWNTTGLAAGKYSFEYVVNGVLPCANDVAVVAIDLKSALNAGGDVQAAICDSKNINLFDYLNTGADGGGVFYYQGIIVSNGIFTDFGSNDKYSFIYEVGDGITCPKAIANIELTKIKKPQINQFIMDDICIGQCRELTIVLDAQDKVELTLIGKNQVTNEQFSEKITIQGSNPTKLTICADNQPPFGLRRWPENVQVLFEISYIRLLSSGCEFEVNQPVTFKTLPLTVKNVNPKICSNETFELQGEVFSFSRPKGDVIIPSTKPAECDTIVHVNLSFYNVAKGHFTASYCDFDKIVTIGDKAFSYNSPSGTATIPGAAQYGCDSIVDVYITFKKELIPGDYKLTTCDDNFELLLGGQVFNKANPLGQATIPDIALGGCDSLVNVSLTFESFDFSYTVESKCNNDLPVIHIVSSTQNGPYSVMIDGEIVRTSTALPVSIPIKSGQHQIQVLNDAGCSKTISEVIPANELSPDVVLTQVPLPDGTVQLLLTSPQNSIYDLSWSPLGTLNCTDCLNPIVNPAETTLYVVNYLYGNDCKDSRSITVERVIVDIIIPNIFSPNGDGVNDKFVIFMPNKVTGTIRNMRIYDRWGNMMFNIKDVPPNDPEFGWNGKFGTGLVNPGVYIYAIEVYFDNTASSKKYSGSITVVH